MNVSFVGVRDLKNQLSRCLDRVKLGECITITEHHRPAARLVPVASDVPQELLELLDRGEASWGGGKPRGVRRSPRSHSASRARHAKTVADIVVEDRR